MGNIVAVLAIGVFALAMSVVFTGTAKADAPVDVSEGPDVIGPIPNPCTDELMFVTITTEGQRHTHNNNEISTGFNSGTTSDGYILERGAARFQQNKNVSTQGFSDMFTHPNGSKFHVRSTFVIDAEDGPRVATFTLKCVKP